MAESTTLGEEFVKEADNLIYGLRSMFDKWRNLQREEKLAMYDALDTAAHEVIDTMSQQEPAGSNTRRRKWFLKPDYAQYFKDRGVAVSNSAAYPFNAAFKLICYGDIEWSNKLTDPEQLRLRSNAESEISHWSNVAALGLMEDKSISQLIEQHGSVREASAVFRKKAAEEEAKREEEEKKRAKENREKLADERRAARLAAEKEKEENNKKILAEQKAEQEARRESARLEAERKKVEAAALEAEKKRKAAQAAMEKAQKLAAEQEDRRIKMEKEAEEAAKRQAEIDEKNRLQAIENERREKELKEQQEQAAAAAKRLAEEEAERAKKEEANRKEYRLSNAKERGAILEGMTECWLKLEKHNGEWFITRVLDKDMLNTVKDLKTATDKAEKAAPKGKATKEDKDPFEGLSTMR